MFVTETEKEKDKKARPRLGTKSKWQRNIPKWVPKEGRHPRAVIYNFSGHPIPTTVFTGTEEKEGLRGRGHKWTSIYTGAVGFFDQNELPEQIMAYLYDAHNNKSEKRPDRDQAFSAEGDKYILLPHVGEASVLITLAVKALGLDLTLITVKKENDGTYQLGRFIDLEDWFRYWRGEGRQDLLLKSYEEINLESLGEEE